MSSVSSFSTDVKPVPKRDQSKRRAGYQPKFTANGRPGKRTPQLEKALLAAIETGAPYRIACLACGISDDAFNEWRRKDPVFAKQVEEAAGKTALRLLKKIEANAEENFSAAAWILERRFPSDFSRPEIQLQINTTNQTINNTLVVTAEVAGEISSRVREVDARIERLLKDKRGGNGAPGFPEVPTVVHATVSAPITKPVGEPSPGWWAQLSQGDNARLIAKEAAVFVCGTLVREVLGGLASQSTTVEFNSEVITLRDLHAAIQDLMGPEGWSALVKKAGRG